MSVADLLSRSRQRHTEAYLCRKRGDLAGNTVALTEARDLRLDAHQQDPDHADPAWAAEANAKPPKRFHHDAVLQFYAQQLADAEPRKALTRTEIAALVTAPEEIPIEDSMAFQVLCREHGV